MILRYTFEAFIGDSNYKIIVVKQRLPWTEHLENGSPVNPCGHEHIGLWLITWHMAVVPQFPLQGSIQRWLEQALFNAHSALDMHSGLQVGGAPKNPGKQEQIACPLTSRHWLFGPQGEGLHGFISSIFFIGRHCRKAFPVNPFGHEHIGKWLYTLQIASVPHVLKHGSTHFFFTQAFSWGQSLLSKHSGLHPKYGSPW